MLPAELSPNLAERLGMEAADDVVEAKGGVVKVNGFTIQVEDPLVHPPMKIHKQQDVNISVNIKMYRETMTHNPDNQIILPIVIR